MLMDPSTDKINKYLVREMLGVMLRNLNIVYGFIKEYIEDHQVIVNIGKQNRKISNNTNSNKNQNNTEISQIAFGQFLQITLWLTKDLVILHNVKKDYHSQMKIFNQISVYFNAINNFSKKKKIRFLVNQLEVKCLNMVYLFRSEQYQKGAKYCQKLVTQLYQFIFSLTHKTDKNPKHNSLNRYRRATKKCYKLLLFALIYQAYFHIVQNNYHPLQALITIIKRIQTIEGPKQLVRFYLNYSQIMLILQNIVRVHQDFHIIFENHQIFSLQTVNSMIENSDKIIRKKLTINSQQSRRGNKKYLKIKKTQNNNQLLLASGSISNRSKIPSKNNQIQELKNKKDVILQGSVMIDSTNNFKKEQFLSICNKNSKSLNLNLFDQQKIPTMKTSTFIASHTKKVGFCQIQLVTSDKFLANQRSQKQNKRPSIASSTKSSNKLNLFSSLHNAFLDDQSQRSPGQINDNFSKRRNLVSKRKTAEMNDLIAKNIIRISDFAFDLDVRNKKFQLVSKRNAQKCSQICMFSEKQFTNFDKRQSFEGLYTFQQLAQQKKGNQMQSFTQNKHTTTSRMQHNRAQSMRSLCSLKLQKKDGPKHKTYRSGFEKLKKQGKDFRNLQMLSETLQQKACPILHRFYKILMKNKSALTIPAFANKIQTHLKRLQNKRMKDMENSKMRRDGISKNSLARFARTALDWNLFRKVKSESQQKIKKKGILNVNKMRSENSPTQKYSKHLKHHMQFQELRTIQQQKQRKLSKKTSHKLITSQIEIDENEPQEVKNEMLEMCHKKSKESIQDLKNKIMKRECVLNSQNKKSRCLKKSSQTYFYL